jgi:GTP-binding protein
MSNSIKSVVIVGRMNVGKSTLFNRLSERVKSITLDYAGVTRDIIKDIITWQNKTFELVDTGGIDISIKNDVIGRKVRNVALGAIEKATVILLVVDGSVGVTTEDREIAKLLRKMGKEVIVIANKADRRDLQEHLYEIQSLGFKELIPLSAQHGTGVEDALEAILRHLPDEDAAKVEKPSYKVVFLGRPNVGKSSLMNVLLKEERSIVAEEPGTTREAISEKVAFYQESIELTDTPGVRRKRAVSGDLEPIMVQKTFGAVKDADVVVLLIDATQKALVDQELKLAFYVFNNLHKALIVLFNKHDLLTPEISADLETRMDEYEYLMDKVPVLHISCKTGKNVGRILPLIHTIWHRYSQKLEPEKLKAVCLSALAKTPLYVQKQELHVRDVRQIHTSPITIQLKVNNTLLFGEAQLGFFENVVRAAFDLVGVPIKWIVSKR